MNYKAVFFDLDETLYPMGNESIKVITDRMNEYIRRSLAIPDSEVKNFRENLYKTYGTTAKGLVKNYEVDLYDFMHYVHNVDISPYIQPAPEVRMLIEKIQIPKFIFTNSDRFHAIRVLKLLDNYQCFDGIIDFLDVYPYCKPEQEAFEKALAMTGIDSGRGCIFLDDNPTNISTAHQLGFYTIQVGSRARSEEADAFLSRIEDLPQLEIYSEIIT
jgi:pyrimidine 5'-nucleotidase